MLDAAGPRVLSLSPSQLNGASLDHVDVEFDRPIDPASFTIEDIAIAGRDGSVTLTDISPIAGNTYRVSFVAQTDRGTYQVVIGPQITDLSGNAMDQDADGTPGEATDDRYVGSSILTRATAFVTGTLTIGVGDSTYQGQDILIDGGTLVLQGAHQFHSIQLIHGGSLRHAPTSGDTGDGLDLTLGGELIADGGTITVGKLQAPEIKLFSNAVLTTTVATTEQVHKLELDVSGGIVVDATSRIDVTGKGYAAGRTTGNQPSLVPGFHGGSHGGLGSGSTARPNLTATTPTRTTGAAAAARGPAAGWSASRRRRCVLDGRSWPTGSPATAAAPAAGSPSPSGLRGGGLIRAAGAAGGWGSGGGGRVAVYAADLSGFDLAGSRRPAGRRRAAPSTTPAVPARCTCETPMSRAGRWSSMRAPEAMAGPRWALRSGHVDHPRRRGRPGQPTKAGPSTPGMAVTFVGGLTVEAGGDEAWMARSASAARPGDRQRRAEVTGITATRGRRSRWHLFGRQAGGAGGHR